MPQNATLQILPRTWTRVTVAAVTALRLQNGGPEVLEVKATVGTVAPTSADGAILLWPREIILPDRPLVQLWPGVPGANHVWVRSSAGASVSVSHV